MNTVIDGIRYSLENGEATIIEQDKSLSGDIVIPETITCNGTVYPVKNIADNAFAKTQITGITLPDDITELGNSCFYSCSNLTSIDLSVGITSLGGWCFCNCPSLTSINLPDSVTALGKECFSLCDSLTSINLPEGITSLGDWCFGNCVSLISIKLPNGVTNLGESCFAGCPRQSSIDLPDSITSLGEYCFEDCSNLTSINLPDSITSLGDNCFDNCLSLTSIDLPDSITELGDHCFFNCSHLDRVICRWKDLDEIKIGSDVFYGIDSECALFVPNGTESMYEAKEPWRNFKHIIERDNKMQTTGQGDQTAGSSEPKTQVSAQKVNLEDHYVVENLDKMSLADKKEKALAILDRMEAAIEHDRWIVSTARMTVENLEDSPSGEFQLTQFLKNPTLNKAYWNLIDAIDNRLDSELEN